MTTQTTGGRGRHRRPRPRKVLFAVGGLALAAGALSLVRLAPESVIGGPGSAEAEPRYTPGAGTGTDRAGTTAATVEALPEGSPSATSPLGGHNATPTPGTSTTPPPTTTAPPDDPATTGTTTIPETPNDPATTAPRPPTTTAPAPHPPPTSGRTTPPPPPRTDDPHRPDDPALCVPIISLCVDLLGEGDGGGIGVGDRDG
ncbi:hypothetical protein [Streptomyces sp. NBC_00588]|uniref:hypothetical protein n=1 Tax=Streptomyces sp. NBC_00588 TaxID=2975784 RepID=UPI002E806E19|nr:hypothetical protein [Streptomyces sp. NBC_00588]WUB37958.1 hypothetical protein OHN38_24775 [Streptomyces sp. NBC_00588]